MKIKNIITLLLLFAATTTSAQELNELYSTRRDSNGKTYILNAQEVFEDEKGRKLTHEVSITCSDNEDDKDMVTITLSFAIPSSQKARTLQIKSRRFSHTTHMANMISITPEKKLWRHKYSVTAPLEKVKELYNPNHPPIITVIQEGGGLYQYTKIHKAWLKYAPMGMQIFDKAANER